MLLLLACRSVPGSEPPTPPGPPSSTAAPAPAWHPTDPLTGPDTPYLPHRVSLDVWGAASMPYVAMQDPCVEHSTRAFVFSTATGRIVRVIPFPPETASSEVIASFTDGPPTVLLVFDGFDLRRFDPEGDLIEQFFSVDTVHHDVIPVEGGFHSLFHRDVSGTTLDGIATWEGTTIASSWWWAEVNPFPVGAADWSHANSFAQLPDGGWLVSLWARDALVFLDADGTLRRSISGGADDPDLAPYVDVDWGDLDPGFGRQHSVRLVDAEHLVVLDNEGGRALWMSFDEANGTARALAAFDAPGTNDLGECAGANGTALPVGDADDQGLLVACRVNGRVVEYALETGAPRWTATVRCPISNEPKVPKWHVVTDPAWEE